MVLTNFNHNISDLNKCDLNWSSPYLVPGIVALVVLIILIIAGNIAVILAVYSNNKLRNVTNMFIVNLACADLLVGLIVIPFAAYSGVQYWIFGRTWCIVWLTITSWTCSASIWNLCVISVVKYIAVTRPLQYRRIITMKRAKILITMVWMLSFLITVPTILNWNNPELPIRWDPIKCHSCNLAHDVAYVTYAVVGSFCIPTLIMLMCYWRIHRIVILRVNADKHGFRRIKAINEIPEIPLDDELTLRIHTGHNNCRNNVKTLLTNPDNIFTITKSYDSIENLNTNKNVKLLFYKYDGEIYRENDLTLQDNLKKSRLHESIAKFRIDNKATKTLTIIVGCYIFCWLPFNTVFFIHALHGYTPLKLDVSFAFLAMSNSGINPWICAIFNKDFGQAFKQIIRRYFCMKKNKN